MGHQRRSRRPSDKQNGVQIGRLLARIHEGLRDAIEGGLDEWANQGLVFVPGNLHLKMQRLARLYHQRFLADLDIRFKAKLLLGFLGRPPEARFSGRMFLAQIEAVALAKLVRQAGGEQIVEVVATEVVVAMAGQHFGDVAFDRDHRNVEGAAAEVVYQHRVARPVPIAVSEAGGRGFIQDAHHLQARQSAGLARGVSLPVGEIGGHRNHGLLRKLAQGAMGPLRQLTQDESRYFLRRELLSAHCHDIFGSHSALDTADRALGVERLLVARRLAYQQIPGRRKSDAGGKHPRVSRPEHAHLVAREGCDLRIRSSQVDADDQLTHGSPLPAGRLPSPAPAEIPLRSIRTRCDRLPTPCPPGA